MRLGVLDVGSNTVHLLVVDAHRGAEPTPQHSDKSELRLAELIDKRGDLSSQGADALVRAVHRRAQAGEGARLRRTARVRDVGRARRPQQRRGAGAGARTSPASISRCSPARTRRG